jgi:hypothetical protein
MTRKALMVTPGYTLLDDDRAVPTPDDTWSGGLGNLLGRVAKTMSGEGVLLVDQAAAEALHLPYRRDGAPYDGPLLDGWKMGATGPWTTFYTDTIKVHVGVTSVLTPDRCPLVCPLWPHDTVGALKLWHDETGHAWAGTPGKVGAALMRELAPKEWVKGHHTSPSWKLANDPMPGVLDGKVARDVASENAFDKGLAWRAAIRHPRVEFEHAYDARRMYLAAAQACEQLAPYSLKETGPIEPDPKRAGWWLLELGAWTDPRIPAPAGPPRGEPCTVWVTTPTLMLLDWLATAGGAYQPFKVLNSYTGRGKRLLRAWGELIEKTYQRATELMSERDAEQFPTARATDAQRVRTAAKEVYRESVGLLNSRSAAIYRPDWHYSIIAQARSTLWRKVWAIGQAEDRWPVEWNGTDTVWYASGTEDPEQGKPRGIDIEDRLGKFQVKNTREAK